MNTLWGKIQGETPGKHKGNTGGNRRKQRETRGNTVVIDLSRSIHVMVVPQHMVSNDALAGNTGQNFRETQGIYWGNIGNIGKHGETQLELTCLNQYMSW